MSDMLIGIHTDKHIFHLRNTVYSYAIGLVDGRFFTHIYWGEPVAVVDTEILDAHRSPSYLAAVPLTDGTLSLDTLPQEYPVWGTGEHREGAFGATLADGSEALRLEYREHEVISGVIAPERMQVLRDDHDLGECQTLRIKLADPRGDLTVDLFYTICERSAALLRWSRIENTAAEGAITLRDPASAVVDLVPGRYDLVTLNGAWARERHVHRTELRPGRHTFGSRGGSSGHQAAPYIALCDPETDERNGRVYALALAYSGNFTAIADRDPFAACRLAIGIGRLRAHLEPGERFETPTALLVRSDRGFGGLSAHFHRVLRDGVVARRWRSVPRKVVINSWEAMYFDVGIDRIRALAREGRAIGAELLVLDDGWFSGRRDDTSSLGDWWPNEERFPGGLRPVADAVRSEGLEFGLWLEPEMVSPDSRLYREHPEWALQISGRPLTPSRNQFVLDLGREDVRDYLYRTISEVLTESGATYVKWDMNRRMTEAGSIALPPERQGETMHRSLLGFYELLERLTGAFPDVLIEGCAGGGGRMDIGLARYSPRFWTSDQTDAVERLPIQYGTTLLFPPEMIGAHVSAVPNHQVGRVTPARTRVLTALPFSFGFELDPATESSADRAEYAEGSRRYRSIRSWVAEGTFLRLRGALTRRTGVGGSGFHDRIETDHAWMVISKDAEEVLVFLLRPLCSTQLGYDHLRLDALTRGRLYRDTESDRVYDAAWLLDRGLRVPQAGGDYQAFFWHLTAVDASAVEDATR